MATVTPTSFASSTVTTLDGWRAFVQHDREPMALLTGDELGALYRSWALLDPADREPG
jgi:hypothetical protein